MKYVAATEAKNRLGAILDEAQHEPVVIRRQDRDIAVLLSMADYEKLRMAAVRELLNVADHISAQAEANGLTEEIAKEILRGDAG